MLELIVSSVSFRLSRLSEMYDDSVMESFLCIKYGNIVNKEKVSIGCDMQEACVCIPEP